MKVGFPVVFLIVAAADLSAAALDWETAGSHRFAPLSLPTTGRTGFVAVPGNFTGIAFTNLLTEERGLTNQVYMSGSGVACGDIDGDGWADLYFCGLDSSNALYRNLGNWRFENITTSAGVSCPGQASTGATFADVDGDGDLDLLVAGIGRGVRLFRNEGRGHFRESTMECGLGGDSAAMTLALADIDSDGDLDLYVANYRSSSIQDEPGLRFRIATANGRRVITMINGRPLSPSEAVRFSVAPSGAAILENGEADLLYRNDGNGKFSPVSWGDGTFLDEDGKPLSGAPLDWSYAAMFRDINGDRAPDLYICSDNDSVDRIWINDGAGRFRALPRLALRMTSLSSMGVDFADLNRDGFDDFLVVDMLSREHKLRHRQLVSRRPLHPIGEIENRPQYPRNTLFLNRGDGTYAEVAQFSGVEASDWSWSPVFLDVDLDGYEDLLITTGLERNLRDADARRQMDRIKAERNPSQREFLEWRKIMPKLATPNYAFRNRGDLTFEETGAAWGFDSREISQGMALADLDSDGDLDVLVNVMNGAALVYRNETAAPRVAVRLRGQGGNTQGIGARIRLLRGAVAQQSQEMVCGGRYLSGDEAMRVFAAGVPTNDLSIEVIWRSGKRTTMHQVKPNRVYRIDETGSSVPAFSPSLARAPQFRDVSDLLRHQHHEEPFNDFERQVLLPRRLSQLGPGVCWADFNGDALDDLIIGAGRGGELGLFANNGRGGFNRIRPAGLGQLTGDATVLSVPTAQGAMLLVGISNYESSSRDDPSVRWYEVWAGGVEPGPSLPAEPSSVGPMALADVEGDGSLELFVGGRVLPGRFPEAASSRLYRRRGGQFYLDPAEQKVFDRVGLVSGVLFSDLDADGFPELILACEWGPLRVFKNRQGQFLSWDARIAGPGSLSSTLSQLAGWWIGVSAGDFDGDGRMDLVAGNWGRNSRYEHGSPRPIRIFHGDINGDGLVETMEAFQDRFTGKLLPLPFHDTLGMALPFVRERFPTSASYSEVGIDEILGEHKRVMQELSAKVFDSMLFLNRGDHFEARLLPLEAQLSPAFGLAVGDMDGDGHEDLFLSQNFFGVDSETSRYDAGRGLWLRGDGQGNLTAVPGTESGVMVYGEQRGAALSDYDRDGRLDLAVTQNGAATRLYRNERAQPGLRVRVEGPAGNKTGVGVVVRASKLDGLGPAREIRAGGGYWSQDSAVQIMALPKEAVALHARWPGGAVTTSRVPAGAREVSINLAGKLTRVN